ncbi:hypothetical protein C9374_008875 [Naegleria lovaniensis]|uniref:RasGEF domain-containing protein n=1 Tax=Naegleria lovaniensis TaxID=51637 RepID=A0AA88GIN6_NAELO|nr:uncharacterized protein C9374_008875 [Naegleria lovaniensis]KAG2377790.1 hypothetical protein C9374_008875 [Naegleria lovaniensis]
MPVLVSSQNVSSTTTNNNNNNNQSTNESNLKTIKIPIELQKSLLPSNLLSENEHSSSSGVLLQEQVIQQLMDYREESLAKAYMMLNVPLPPNLPTLKDSFTANAQLIQPTTNNYHHHHVKENHTPTQTLSQFYNENPKVEKLKPATQDKFHQTELKKVTKQIQNQVEKAIVNNAVASSQTESAALLDREQWMARALKRNPNVLALMERMRPLSKQSSHSATLMQHSETGGFSSSSKASSTSFRKLKSQASISSDPNSPRVSTGANGPLQRNPSETNIGGSINMNLLNGAPGTGFEAGTRDSVPGGATGSTNSISALTSNPAGLSLLMGMTDGNGDMTGATNDQEKQKRSALDYADVLGTVENREVLSREVLLQLVYQHLSQRGLYETIAVMEEETGIKYNGHRSDKTDTKDSLITTLLCLGIKDIEKPYVLPQSDLIDLDTDVEVQTASIYHHFEEDDVGDMRKPLWAELLSNEDDNIDFVGSELKSASLNKLIERLTNPDTDARFIQCFLVTYRSFTVPEILLHKLCQRYRVPKCPKHISPEVWNKNKETIQIRTGNIFTKWIDEFFTLDWNENMIREVTVFIEDFLLKHKQTSKMGLRIRGRLAQKLASSRNKEEKLSFSEIPVPPVVPATVFSPKLSIWDIREDELAKQITYMDHNLYRNIEAHELLNCSWSKPKLKHRSKNVIKSIDFFNRLSNWFATQITHEESFRERKAKLAKLMNLAKHMFRLNNFNSLMALNSAYENSAVHRLNMSINEIDEKLREEFTACCKVMAPDSSFKTYRTHIKQEVKPPLNIYLGIYLTDLTFIEDGNPDMIKHSKTNRMLINYKKRQLVANQIAEVMQYKNPPYNIQHVHQIQELLRNTLHNHQIIDDKVLHTKSVQVEPRGARREDLKP